MSQPVNPIQPAAPVQPPDAGNPADAAPPADSCPPAGSAASGPSAAPDQAGSAGSRPEPPPLDLSNSYTLLRNAILFDTKERFEILREEIEHFTSAVAFRAGGQSTGNGGSSGTSSPPNSQSAFLQRLAASADQLKEECEADLKEIAEFGVVWGLDHAAHLRSKASQLVVDDHECFAILWNAKLHEKAIVIVERLGDLHDRLDQFLQRTNPDHPDPTLRRRSEQGLTDKYLSEFTRWVHRDLVLFARSAGASYPYLKLPSTYQFWAYDLSSRQHAFMPLDAHMEWKDTVESSRYAARIETPRKFTSISLSYWIPERPTLVPIIGHELAHQVFRDLYGRELNFVSLEDDASEIGRMFRRLIGAVEIWLAPRFPAGRAEPKVSSYLVQEIMCDCLAAVRFGYAYAYAWVLETVSNERFAQIFQDEYGMLRRFSASAGADADGDSSVTGDLKRLQEEALLSTLQLQSGIFYMYYRGVVLAKLLEQLGLENDTCAQGLDVAFRRYLDLMLQLHTRGNPERAAWERQMAGDLASKLVHEWLVDDGDDGYGNSAFVKKVRNFWAFQRRGLFTYSLAEPSLRHQQMNHTFRRLVEGIVADRCQNKKLPNLPNLSAITDPRAVRTLTDLTWRLEWLIESEKLARKDTEGKDPAVESLRSSVRAVMFLGMDDYLIRTANPVRLFSVLVAPDDESIGELGNLSTLTNTLDSARLERLYGKEPLKTLNEHVAARENERTVTVLGRDIVYDKRFVKPVPRALRRLALQRQWVLPKVGVEPREREVAVTILDKRIALDGASLKYLVHPLLHGDIWQDLITGQDGGPRTVPGQYVLELMKVRGGGGVLGKGLSITERDGDNTKYKAKCSAPLLGRYDAMVLHEQVRQDGEIGWKVSIGAPGEVREDKAVVTVSRAKRLVPILGAEPVGKIDRALPVLAVVLVSLKWDASRALVAKWLSGRKLHVLQPGLKVHAFLGDGWEDLVLLASLGSEPPGAAIATTGGLQAQAFKALTDLIQSLNRNPFVGSTETLFSNLILKAPPTDFQFRFAFRVAERGYQAARKAIHDACLEVCGAKSKKLSLHEVAGNKDFELTVPPDLNDRIERLHEAFHAKADAIYRIETRTAWLI